MTATRSKDQGRRRSADQPQGGGVNTNVLIGVGLAIVAVVVAAIVIFAVAGGNDTNSAGSTEVAAAGEVTVTGDTLPPFTNVDGDGAVGMTMPEITAPVLGAGNRITFADTGKPRVLIFLAHWCPHCQADVRAITQWLDDGNEFPAGVDIQSLSFRVDPGRGNYPVSTWLRDEGWPYTTLVDDESGTLDQSLGAGGTPFYIFINADGTIAGRIGGELGPDTLDTMLTELEAGQPLTGING
jgi:thiol-disulfide isomerase/thioredoxin